MIESARDAVKKEAVQKAIDYIESHLPEPLPLEKLAGAAGYSKFHFQRMFLETVHMTPAVYIRRRRISEVVRAMEAGEESISALAFAWDSTPRKTLPVPSSRNIIFCLPSSSQPETV